MLIVPRPRSLVPTLAKSESRRTGQSDSGWDSRALSADPHVDPDKASMRHVRPDSRETDLSNRIHSLGRDQAWRKRAVKMARYPRGIMCSMWPVERAT